MIDHRMMVVDCLLALARRKDTKRFGIGRHVAAQIWDMLETYKWQPELPDDMRDLIHNTSYLEESIAPAAKVARLIMRRGVDGLPPMTLNSRTALLVLCMICNWRFYRAAWYWGHPDWQSENSKRVILKWKRRPAPPGTDPSDWDDDEW